MDEWQQKVEDTLKRIEQQSDDTDIQEGFSLNFREKVLTTLVKLDGDMSNMNKDLQDHVIDSKEQLKTCLTICGKIPIIETGLNNHLHTHDNLSKYVMYPTGAALVLAALAAFAKLILHVF